MGLTIKVEFSPGCDISDAFQEAIDLSNRIQVDIDFNFNDVKCFVKPGGSVRKGVYEYHETMKSKDKHKFARSF